MLRTGKRAVIVAMSLVWLVAVAQAESHAGSTPKVVHSKDYKKFPKGSPEAVLTDFIEADLGDFYNRDADERFPLWWNLTEKGGIPEDDNLKLFINSYNVKKIETISSVEAVIALELDVRAISPFSTPESKTSRPITVALDGTVYKADGDLFIERVFGKDEVSNKIIKKIPGQYIVPSGNRKWMLLVRVIKKANQWVIANDSVPPQVSYLSTVISILHSARKETVAFKEACKSKKNFSPKIFGNNELIKREINNDYQKFVTSYCDSEHMRIRDVVISRYDKNIRNLQISGQ